MSYEIIIAPYAKKQLSKLDEFTQDRILLSLNRIRIRPYSYVKKMTGSPFYRLRVGFYRVILEIKDDVLIILVIKIGHRKNIYK